MPVSRPRRFILTPITCCSITVRSTTTVRAKTLPSSFCVRPLTPRLPERRFSGRRQMHSAVRSRRRLNSSANMKISKFLAKAALGAAFASMFGQIGAAQGTTAPDKIGIPAAQKAAAAAPKVVQIDIDGLKKLLKPNGKPLLINFWATWCDPCRDEFPDLVKIDAAYRGKIDFITISLDDLADIDTFVPKFLTEMKTGMPAFLLYTPDV